MAKACGKSRLPENKKNGADRYLPPRCGLRMVGRFGEKPKVPMISPWDVYMLDYRY